MFLAKVCIMLDLIALDSFVRERFCFCLIFNKICDAEQEMGKRTGGIMPNEGHHMVSNQLDSCIICCKH